MTEKRKEKNITLEDLGLFMNEHGGAKLPDDILLEYLVRVNYKRAVYKGMGKEPELEEWHEAILSLESSSQGLIKQTTLAATNASLTSKRLLLEAQTKTEQGTYTSFYEKEKIKHLWPGYLVKIEDLRTKLPYIADQGYEIPGIGSGRTKFLVDATRR